MPAFAVCAHCGTHPATLLEAQAEAARAREEAARLSAALLDRLDLLRAIREDCERAVEDQRINSASPVHGGACHQAGRVLTLLDGGKL